MSTPNLLDAIRVVKETERIASVSYTDAAQNITRQKGKILFEQLAEFEKYHYDQLTALEISLEETGDYINYVGKEFPIPPKFEIKAAQEPNTKSVMGIITEAMDLEKQMEEAYTDLAVQITDPLGHEMFSRLAKEENLHYQILGDAYRTLNNFGIWKWSRP